MKRMPKMFDWIKIALAQFDFASNAHPSAQINRALCEALAFYEMHAVRYYTTPIPDKFISMLEK